MLSRILLMCLVLVFAGMLFAQDEQPAPEKSADKPVDGKSSRNLWGIIVQVVIFVLFLVAVYYIFVYPEKPDDKKTEAAAKSEAGAPADEQDTVPTEADEDKAGDVPAEDEPAGEENAEEQGKDESAEGEDVPK